MHLYPQIGNGNAGIGAAGLGNRCQKRGTRLPVGGTGGPRHVGGGSTTQGDGTGDKQLCLHGGQHTAHIGMARDAVTAPFRRAALTPVGGKGGGLLIGRFGNTDALATHPQTGIVHHGEHRLHPLMRCTDQPAHRPVILHHRRRRSMQPQFMFQTDDLQAVRLPRIACGIGQVLWHHEQADPSGARFAIRQARQHQMADIGGKVVIPPRDIDLLPGHGVAILAQRFGLAAQCPDIGTGLRFCQVHRAAPGTADQLWQIDRLQVRAGVMFQRLDLTLRHQRVQLQRQTRPCHHFIDRRGQHHRQPHAAVIRRRRHADPAAVSNRPVALGKAGAGADNAIFQPRRMTVAHPLQRCQNIITQPRRFAKDRIGQIRRCFGKPRRGPDRPDIHHMLKQKAVFGGRGAVGHGILVPVTLGIASGGAYGKQGWARLAQVPVCSIKTPRHSHAR